MSQFGIKFDTTSEERRDRFYAALIAALNVSIGPGDKATITFTFERPTFRGKRKVTTTVDWEDGQDPPTFADIGIYATQYDLFAQPSTGRTYTAPIGDEEPTTTTVDEATGEVSGDAYAVADITQPWTEPTDEQPASHKDAHETGLDIFRKFLSQLDGQQSAAEAAAEAGPEVRDLEGEATDEQADDQADDEDAAEAQG